MHKLLVKHDIKAKHIEIYNDFSSDKIRNKIKKFIEDGNVVSLVSDAGTPLISDPGYKLVNSLIESNLYVDSIPGPCAVINALVLSGLPTDKFTFHGFLPKGLIQKEKYLKSLKNIQNTLIFYETSPRLIETINVTKRVFDKFDISIVKEMTKIHQTILKSDDEKILTDILTLNLKGEFVLLLKLRDISNNLTDNKLEDYIKDKLKKRTSSKDIANNLIENNLVDLTKNQIYKIIEKLK